MEWQMLTTVSTFRGGRELSDDAVMDDVCHVEVERLYSRCLNLKIASSFYIESRESKENFADAHGAYGACAIKPF
jgi:hypothetical protein